jgi:uncharacterized protein YbdZ (MbtH family)
VKVSRNRRSEKERYSIRPAYKENPLDWNDAGKTGTKSEVLAYIKEVTFQKPAVQLVGVPKG